MKCLWSHYLILNNYSYITCKRCGRYVLKPNILYKEESIDLNLCLDCTENFFPTENRLSLQKIVNKTNLF